MYAKYQSNTVETNRKYNLWLAAKVITVCFQVIIAVLVAYNRYLKKIQKHLTLTLFNNKNYSI